MAVGTPNGGNKTKVDGEVANSSDNVEEPLGIITLVIDKNKVRMTPSIKDMTMEEVRLYCQQFLRMVENTIFEVERDKIKNSKGG